MPIFRTVNEQILVDTYAVDVFIPAEYLGSEYRGTSYYSIIGNQVRYFAVANFRVYHTEKQFKDPLSVLTYPLGIPMTILCKPSEIDTREVKFTVNGPIRKCIVLTFYKNDEFISNVKGIANGNHVMMLLWRLSGGKLTHIPPTVVAQMVPDAEKMNKVNLRISPEELEMYISERYRNPNNPSQKLRFSSADLDSDKEVSYRVRDEVMKSNTYQAVTHEDPNNALIVSTNRARRGEYNEPTIAERIVRGMSIDDIIERDSDVYDTPNQDK